jgi:hypothetical protein
MAVATGVQTWCLWRAIRRCGGLQRVEERLSSVTRTLDLLIDTTEACFCAVGEQIARAQPAPRAAKAGRAARQRRVVRAARRGRSVTEIAAAEDVAEREVHLRLQLADQDIDGRAGHHGSMHT